MNLKRELARAFILALLSAVAFGFTAFLVSEHKVVRFDDTVMSFIQSFESPSLTWVMKFFTWIGSGTVITVLSILTLFILAKVFKYRSELILFVVVVAGASILDLILKSLFHRARPSLHRLIEARGFSFPSGHSMEAVAFYGILSFLLWRHIPNSFARGFLLFLSTIMILAIGISRIYLGVHYPSDIIGGYFASGCWLAAAIWYYQRYREKQYEKKSM
jgi:undecaprenyl-diphosphatase